jgi:predicted SPOUT superfamily RNA methylase MTH1
MIKLGTIEPDKYIVGSNTVSALYLGGSKVWSFISAPTFLHKLTASDKEAEDYFGYSVAISGDYIVVGAFLEYPDGISAAGSAYIFDAVTGDQLHKLTASDKESGDYFGYSVAISGDKIVVGAAFERADDIYRAGSAYVFDAVSGDQLHKLTASDKEANDYFAKSVSISGDKIVIGAYLEDPDGISDAGSAYIFDAVTGDQLHKLTASDKEAGDNFGVSVAISGDNIVVGANHEDPDGISDAGSAYIFDAVSGNQLNKLTASDKEATDNFGYSVAISGDNIVVGANQENPDGSSNAGSAYIFDAVTGDQLHKLTASDKEAGDYFGYSVAISGDNIVVGAFLENPEDISDAGSAYIFDTATGNELHKLTAYDKEAYDKFGFSVAISGGNIVVGAYQEDPDGISAAGSAYVYSL